MALLKLRLSENFQFYTMLHYWHLLYRGKKNWQVGVCHVKYLQKSMESCFILLFSHDHEVLYELPREWTNKICEDTSSVYKLQVLVCHTVYQPCLPESAISWVHSLLKAAQLLCRPRASSIVQLIGWIHKVWCLIGLIKLLLLNLYVCKVCITISKACNAVD